MQWMSRTPSTSWCFLSQFSTNSCDEASAEEIWTHPGKTCLVGSNLIDYLISDLLLAGSRPILGSGSPAPACQNTHLPPSQHPPSPNPLLFSAPVNWSRHHPATHALQLQMIECFNQLPFLPNWHENKTHINMSYHQQSTIPFAELDQIPPLAAAAKPPLSSHDKQRIASSNLHSCLILPPPSKWPPAIHACLA